MSTIKSAEPGFGSYEYADDPADCRTSKRPASPTESMMDPPKEFKSVLKVDIKTGRVLDGRFDTETGRVLYEKEKGDEKMPAKSPIPSREEVVELINACKGSINLIARLKKVGWSTAKKWVENHGLTEVAQIEADKKRSQARIEALMAGQGAFAADKKPSKQLIQCMIDDGAKPKDAAKFFSRKVSEILALAGEYELAWPGTYLEDKYQRLTEPQAEARQRNIDEDDDGVFPVTPQDNIVVEYSPKEEMSSMVNESEVAKVNRHEVIIEVAGRMLDFPTREAALDYLKKTIRLYELKVEMVPVPLRVAVEEGVSDE